MTSLYLGGYSDHLDNPTKAGKSDFFVVVLLMLHGDTAALVASLPPQTHPIIQGDIAVRRSVLEAVGNSRCDLYVWPVTVSRLLEREQEDALALKEYLTNLVRDRLYIRNNFTEKFSLGVVKKYSGERLDERFCRHVHSAAKKHHSRELNAQVISQSDDKIAGVVELLAWAVTQKYQLGKEDYYEIIRSKIFEEKALLE